MLYRYQIYNRSPLLNPFIRRWDVYEIQPSGWSRWVARFKKYEDAVFYVDGRILEQVHHMIEDVPLDSRLNAIRSSLVSSSDHRATPVAPVGKSSVRAREAV